MYSTYVEMMQKESKI